MAFYYSTLLHVKTDVSGQLTLQCLVPAELTDEKLWLSDSQGQNLTRSFDGRDEVLLHVHVFPN